LAIEFLSSKQANHMPLDRPAAIFVGNHLALDFLNTVATPQGEVVDWLRDGQDLVRWLQDAQVVDSLIATRTRSWRRDSLDEVARQAGDFRKWLRGFVMARMGKPLHASARSIAPLNERLARDKSFPQVEVAKGGTVAGRRLVLRRLRRWESPEELIDPLVEAAADLICHQDFRWIRCCEGSGCCLMFLDRTKGHARRWCSMAVCGNRAKVQAHRAKEARKRGRAI
jgi:predicted RNA-binding Zn ribbon-like protein